MPKIFISYRREDSQHQADRLHAALKRHVASPKRDIFIDIDNIPVGVDFKQHLDAKVAECDLLLALIGPDWLNAGATLLGGRRIDDPKDFVRIEIAAALKRGIRVAPILLDGASMPKESELPDDLKPLAVRNAAEVRRATFDADAERMIRGLNLRRVGGPQAAKSAPARSSGGGSWIAPVVALIVLAIAGGGAWLWFADPLGWKAARSAEATPSAPAPSPAVSPMGSGDPPPPASQVGDSAGAAKGSPPPPKAGEVSTEGTAATPAPAVALSPDAAKAALTVAQANLANAETNQKRVQDMFNNGFTSQAELSGANTDLQAAKSAVAARQKDYQSAIGAMSGKTPKPVETFRDCSDCPEMVMIPAGSFMMGSPASEKYRADDEGPQRRVTLPAFASGKYEVTWAEWNRCIAESGCRRNALQNESLDPSKSTLPAVRISWNDAKAYVAWLSRKTGKNYRLLSEAEWEYAARAGTTTPYSFGKSISPSQANYNWERKDAPTVGQFPPNAFGLYDMHGNVWEWVEDCYEDSYSAGQPTDGSAFTTGSCFNRVDRGGSFSSGAALLRSAVRSRGRTEPIMGDIGFRIARTLP